MPEKLFNAEELEDSIEDEVEDELEDETESPIKREIETAIQPSLDRIDAGEYATKDEAIDALIADLEAARGGENLGGLGIEDQGFELPEEDELEV